MQITVFTSNQPRHVALIERLAAVAERVYAVQECSTVFPGRVADFFRKSEVMQRYFERVIAAEQVVFGGTRFAGVGARGDLRGARSGVIRSLPVRMGDLAQLELSSLGDALRSDLFIVFGSSFIRGDLCEFLVDRAAINIHMGIAPQYRGSSCNFWAMYDRRPDLVGATIHRLTSGLDSGPILFHALPPAHPANPFELGMQAVKAAQEGLIDAIQRDIITSVAPLNQQRELQIRYTRNADFTDDAASEYLSRAPLADEIGRALSNRELHAFARPYVGSTTRPCTMSCV